jgi:hypothetical protein
MIRLRSQFGGCSGLSRKVVGDLDERVTFALLPSDCGCLSPLAWSDVQPEFAVRTSSRWRTRCSQIRGDLISAKAR